MHVFAGLRAFRAMPPVTGLLLIPVVCSVSAVAATAAKTAAEVAPGRATGSAMVAGPSQQGALARGPAAVSILLAENPAISIRMTASPEQFTAAGQGITYTYYVANTGDLTLDPVTVTDSLPGLTGLTCTATMLVSEASLTCVAHYVTTPGDVALGHVTNSAAVAGLSPQGVQLHAPAEVSIPLAAHPAISIAKSASVARFSAAGEVITYRYQVRNTGNVPLHSVRVTDSKAGAVSCPASTLAPGASITCTARYTITAADVAARNVTNTGTVAGQTAGGAAVRAQSSLSLPRTAAPPIPPAPPPPVVKVPVQVTG